jgi:quinol monooxygenase YgiN
MIKRIVRMTFHPERTSEFESLFLSTREKIKSTPGCLHLEWWQDLGDPRVYYTFSFWESEQHLENYKNTETFKWVWPKTKAMFAAPPQAWSVIQKEEA